MKNIWKPLSFALLFLLTLVAVVAMPIVGDLPDDTSAKVVNYGDQHYLILDGSISDSLSYMSVVRVFSSGDSSGNVLLVDEVSAIWPVFSPGPVVAHLPRCENLKYLDKGPWSVKVRGNGKYKTVFRFINP